MAADGKERAPDGHEAAAEPEYEDYEALRERFWELASVEGVSLAEFVDAALVRAPAPAPAEIARLCQLVEDVEDTILQNIALKSTEEGGVFGTLADERIEEVQEERAVLLDRLRSPGD